MKEKREGRLGEVKGKGEGGLGEMPPQRIAFDFQRSGFPVSMVLDEILNRFQRIKSPEGGEMLRNRVGGGGEGHQASRERILTVVCYATSK